jgi:hypothetical protein
MHSYPRGCQMSIGPGAPPLALSPSVLGVARAAHTALEDWLQRNGWAGYDPYDIRGQDWYFRLFGGSGWVARKARGVLWIAETSFDPLVLRRLLRIAPAVNAKGMGLMALAHLRLATLPGNEHHRPRAEAVLDWLSQHACQDYAGRSWGYPFHWNSRIPIPRGTPSVVVTCTVGDAWLEYVRQTGSSIGLQYCQHIADFLLHGLNRTIIDAERCCFSYTPLDHFKVHNANLFAASFLTQFSVISNNRQYLDIALAAARYTISEQNVDGSFYYWGSEAPTIVDHYHTGFVLRHLTTVFRASQDEAIFKAIERGYLFYTTTFFDDDGAPRFTPTSRYPIDIHSCAEAILVFAAMSSLFGHNTLLDRVIEFTCRRMINSDGSFIAKIDHSRGQERMMRIPYHRWGQSWMFLALSSIIVTNMESTRKKGV